MSRSEDQQKQTRLLVSTLHGMFLEITIDDEDIMKIRTEVKDGSTLYTTGRPAPTTERQLSAIMQTLAREIWHHHLRQTTKE